MDVTQAGKWDAQASTAQYVHVTRKPISAPVWTDCYWAVEHNTFHKSHMVAQSRSPAAQPIACMLHHPRFPPMQVESHTLSNTTAFSFHASRMAETGVLVARHTALVASSVRPKACFVRGFY